MTFLAGEYLTADLLNGELGAMVSSTQNTSGTTTATTFVNTLTGGAGCGVVFVAPTSGKVLFTNTTQAFNSGTGFVYCTIGVRAGAVIGVGTVILGASDENATTSQAPTASYRMSAMTPLSGLTPGASYNVQQFFRVSANTGTFLYKNLIVKPTP